MIDFIRVAEYFAFMPSKAEKIRKHPRYADLQACLVGTPIDAKNTRWYVDSHPETRQKYRELARLIARETRTTPNDVRNATRSELGRRGRPRGTHCPMCGAPRHLLSGSLEEV